MQQGETSTIRTQNQSATPPPSPLINLPSLGDDANGDFLASPRRSRRWIVIVVVILLVILLGALIFRATHQKPSVTYQNGQATQGNLTITVNATGPIQSGTYNLIFSGTGGKIDEIDVAVGQKVTQGQVLARLDKTALQDAVNQAQIAVNNAQASLNAAINSAGSSSGQSGTSVTAAQTAVTDAQSSQSQTKANGQASVNSAQTALTNAQTNLTNVTNTANAQKQSALTAYQTSANAANATPTTSSASTPTPSAYSPCPSSPPSDISGYSPMCQQAITTYNSTIAQANSSVATAQAQVNTAQTALNQAQAAANSANTTAQNQVDTAKNQVKSSQAGAGVSGTTGQSQITTAQSQLNTALAQLTQAKHNLDNATLKAPHSGTVTLINGTVGGTPGASATGTATGTTGSSAFIQIADTSALQVQANVNEADIANLQIGEISSFTVDAYGNQQFTGTVSAIPPIGQTISNVVTYPVNIDVDPNSLKGAHLLPSMTANITINAIQHNNVLLLPVNAINFARLASSGNTTSGTNPSGGTPQLITPQQANSALNQARQMLSTLEVANPNLVSEGPTPAFVIEQSGRQFVARPIVLGLTDGTSYEVLQGLSLSDTFIVGTK